jgi:predicted MFS family arabinose efflux permease
MMNTIASADPPHATAQPRVWHAALAGFSASLVGIGLARFAYTPLLPALVAAHWFSASIAAYLQAANLAGYLAGALLGRPLAARSPAVTALRAMMLLASVALLACAFPAGTLWFFGWRFLSGFAGGALMVLAAPAVLPHVPARRRGLVGGLIFMGIGIGIAASGTLLPMLLQLGVRAAWLGLGALSLLLTALAWGGWPRAVSAAAPSAATAAAPGRTLLALYASYALNAVGWVPHMLFLADFIARGLGLGLRTAALYWVLFGIGASLGPIAVGNVADRIGFGRTLRLAFAFQALAVALPAVATGSAALTVSSVLVGAFVTGTVPLVLGRIHELLPGHPQQQGHAWRSATAAFAVAQALAAWALSFLFGHGAAGYGQLFLIGAGAIVLSLAVDLLFTGRRGPARSGVR